MIKANQLLFQFEDNYVELNLKESIQFFAKHLDPRFVREKDYGFRTPLNSELDLAVSCVSQYEDEDSNYEYQYLVQTLSKNNTIRTQECYNDIKEVVEVLNKRAKFLATNK